MTLSEGVYLFVAFHRKFSLHRQVNPSMTINSLGCRSPLPTPKRVPPTKGHPQAEQAQKNWRNVTDSLEKEAFKNWTLAKRLVSKCQEATSHLAGAALKLASVNWST